MTLRVDWASQLGEIDVVQTFSYEDFHHYGILVRLSYFFLNWLLHPKRMCE